MNERRERVGVLVLAGLRVHAERPEAWESRVRWLRDELRVLAARDWRPDLILLPGNLTARGNLDDFTFLHVQIDALRRELARDGVAPAVIAVPGPSDVIVDAETDPGARVLAEDWAIRPEIQSDYRRDPKGLWQRVALQGFGGFCAWWWALSKEQSAVRFERGEVLGDGVATVTVRGLRVAVMCVNSALEHLGGHRPERACVDPWRLDALREATHDAHLGLMLMHHRWTELDGRGRERATALLESERAPIALAVSAGASARRDRLRRWIAAPALGESPDRSDDLAEGFTALTLDVGAEHAWVEAIWRRRDGDGDLLEAEIPRRGRGFIEEAPRPRASSPDDLRSAALAHFRGRKGAESLTRAAFANRSELEDFVYENFPEVHQRFWEKIPFDAGVRLLVESEEASKVVDKIAQTYPSTVKTVLERDVARGVDYVSVKLK